MPPTDDADHDDDAAHGAHDDDDDDDKVRISAWLRQQRVPRQCPTCGHPACLVGDLAVLASATSAEPAGFAVVPVICPRCTHVRLFAPPVSAA